MPYTQASSTAAIDYCVTLYRYDGEAEPHYAVQETDGPFLPRRTLRLEFVPTYGEAERMKDQWVGECQARKRGGISVTITHQPHYHALKGA